MLLQIRQKYAVLNLIWSLCLILFGGIADSLKSLQTVEYYLDEPE